MTRISGYLFNRDGDRWLRYRKSWWSYAAGCVVAVAIFLTSLLFLLHLLSDRTIYVGGGRGRRGTPVAPANQTWSQFAESTVCMCAGVSPALLLPIAYVVFGSEEQRKPFVFDRQRNQVTYGGKKLCSVSQITVIRLVETPVGRSRPRLSRRTGIFARLNGAPWSIELGCFSRFHTAQRFAEQISGFLNVALHVDPIVVGPPSGFQRGFEVITRAPDHSKLPGDER